MKIVFLLLGLLFVFYRADVNATESIECETDKHLIRFYVGSAGGFNNVLFYQDGIEEFIILEQNKLEAVKFNKETYTFNFVYKSDKKNIPNINLKTNDGKGTVTVNDKTFSIECYWPF